jgi:hypothetical protein
MFKILNNYLFNQRARKYLSITPRDHRFVSYHKAKTILLLFESDYSEKNTNVHRIISQMQLDGKKVSAWGFIDKKEIVTAIYPDFRILHHKQTDFFHKPLESYINELQYSEFDLLIDLSVRSVIPLEYLAMYSIAAFKTGIRKTDIPMYDFVLDMENISKVTESTEPTELSESPVDETYLYNQIIFYLKSIQTTD